MITRLFNAATKATTAAVSFQKLPKQERERLRKTGVKVTEKGAFLPTRPGEKRGTMKGGITKLTAATKASRMTSFEFFVENEGKSFVHDPRDFINRLRESNPEVWKDLKGKRKRYQLVFAAGSQDLNRSLDELEEYLTALIDDAAAQPTNGATAKLKSIEKSLVAVRVTTHEPIGKAKAKRKTTRRRKRSKR